MAEVNAEKTAEKAEEVTKWSGSWPGSSGSCLQRDFVLEPVWLLHVHCLCVCGWGRYVGETQVVVCKWSFYHSAMSLTPSKSF